MKAKKWIFILCALLVLIIMAYACQGEVSESTFQLNGKDCHFSDDDARLSQYPEPYCSLKKDGMIESYRHAEISSGLNKRPFYKIWLRNDQETDCTYSDAKVSDFLMLGGEPGDMTYSGITFGQTEEETDALAEKAKKTKNVYDVNTPGGDFEIILRTVLFQELGENWKDQIKWVGYSRVAAGKVRYKLDVIFVEGKVYAMGLSAESSVFL